MSEPTARALEVFSGHLRRIEEGKESDLDVLCRENEDLAAELRQLHDEWSRMSDVLDRLGSKQGTLSLQLKERYGESVDPEISLSKPEDGGPIDESSAALMSKLSSQGGSERYHTREEIARGGMGAILNVWDEDLRRPLAMKVALREDGETSGAATDKGSQKRLSRFLEEAQITSQLDHPGIVPVHDLGIDAEGRVYFTMQLVDGRDMRDVVAMAQAGEEGWDLRRLVGVLVRVCEALAYAHSKGVVHRDIKPGNVMVGKFGEVFLMDWGLAKVMGREEIIDEPTSTIIHTLRSDGSSAQHTIAGDVVGTPAFMAPEQALGRSDEIGPPSDLYAVGAMLYLMLTGQVPYQPLGESVSAMSILEAVKKGPPWPIEKLNPDAPPELVAICEKAMAREISDRFSDSMELGDEIRNWLEGHAVATYETGVFYGLRKWIGRNKGMAASLLALLVVVIGGLGLWLQQKEKSIQDLQAQQATTKEAQRVAEENAVEAQFEAARANEESVRADKEASETKKLAEQNRRARYRAHVVAAWYSLRVSEAHETRWRLESADIDLQGWEWRHLNLAADDSVRLPIAHPNGSMDLVVVGEDIVSMGSDAVVRIFDPVDWSHEDLAVRYGVPASFTQFAKGGAQFAMGRNVCALSVDGVLATATQSAVILLWNLESLDLIAPLTDAQASSSPRAVMDLAFSADGQYLASVNSGGVARVWNASRDSLGKTVSWSEVGEADVGGSLNCITFHPIKQRIAFGAEGGRVEVWTYGDEKLQRLGGFIEDHGSSINALAYSNDGTLLACAGDDGEVQIWKEEDTEVEARLVGEGFSFARSQLEKVVQFAKKKEPKHTLPGSRLGTTCLGFSWDDRVIYAGGRDGTVRAWSTIDGGERGRWEGHQGTVSGLALFKGEHILSGAQDGTLRLFDPYWMATRQPIGGGESISDPVLFVSEGGYGGDGEEVGALAVCAKGTILKERPEAALGALRSFSPGSDSWVAGARVGEEYIALVGDDERALVLDLFTGALARSLEGHDAGITGLAADDMGARMITGSSDSRAIIWEGIDPSEELESWSISHSRGVVAVGISADAKVVGTADKDKTVQLWDAEERRLLQIWSSKIEGKIDALAIAPDGEQLASASLREVRVFRVGEPEPVAVLGPHQADVRAVVFHDDGERLVSGDAVGGLYLWDVHSAERLLVLSGHDAAITSLAFVDGGKTLLSGDANGVVFAWRSDREQGRYERWKTIERRPLRVDRIMRYFEGDLPTTYQRLKEGVPGLMTDDPAVVHLLEVLAPSAEQEGSADGE